MLDTADTGSTTSPPPYRGRFAPSPTGPLHLGSLYTALASFLQARARGGIWLLRIDDIDRPRVVPGAADRIRQTLEYFGLTWDGPVTSQSTHLDDYRQALGQLVDRGLTYRCTCSRKQLRMNPGDDGETGIYLGHCRDATRHPEQAHALRLRAGGRIVAFNDKLQGRYQQDFSREIGDFIVRRRDDVYAYHLATVVDDARSGISEVLRGSDLLAATPCQIILQQELGLPTPDYLHIPVVTDRTGVKLSKQTGAAAVPLARPSATLYRLLTMLRQNPPADLSEAPKEALLDWAIRHWDVSRLKEDGLSST
ncbi:tRNA glutamyl-Q(34) synthetase GluQRS [Methylococcus sp. EFPC2]|uniref:tRNA glutamyl-Q(34) synthetase GluQRS n=1 Tax=Methylococcus sp. EFPC2 TaxID=2812648 RepID=UPI001967801A|nr:tRNA glutamyl-Q(34) synthetase GluQRS [Methylococcus sp. EFPC2]QSA98794.1 tRNA glutamyl-Q(34) synthetase GluQRS [Methylococcus sp. EFPC2]